MNQNKNGLLNSVSRVACFTMLSAVSIGVGMGMTSLVSAQPVVCKGEWSYKQYEKCQSATHKEIYNVGVHADCGIKSEVMTEDESCPVISYQSCRDSSHGIEMQKSVKSVVVDDNCHENCSVEKKCTDAIPKLRSDYPNAEVSYVPNSINEKHIVISKALKMGKYETTCKFQVSYGVNKEMKSDACPVKERTKCKAKMVYNSCPHRNYGVKGYASERSVACPIENAVLISKAQGLSKGQMLLSKAVVPESLNCSTCDDRKLDEKNFGARLECLAKVTDVVLDKLYQFQSGESFEGRTEEALVALRQRGESLKKNIDETLDWIKNFDSTLMDSDVVRRLLSDSEALRHLIL